MSAQAPLVDAPGAAGATFDPTRAYRYRLWRTWSREPRACFVMLNPSTADELVLDPTVRRCVGFARRWGYGGLDVVNLFALRSTDPRVLERHPGPVGPGNDKAIVAAASEAGLVVVAWGRGGELGGRDADVLELLARFDLYAVRILPGTRTPGHPLYVPKTARPVMFLPGTVRS